MSTRVVAITDDGTEHDVTEAVLNTFEAIEHSMDWGSGFLDIEEVISMTQLAMLCGFRTPDQTKNSIDEYVRVSQPYCGICRVYGRGEIHVDRDAADGITFTYPCGHKGRIIQERGKPSSIVFEGA